MMMHGMGGGIGGTLIMGWPLADWATILLLLIVSIMIVAFVSAILSFLKPPLDRTPRRNGPQAQSQPRSEVPSK